MRNFKSLGILIGAAKLSLLNNQDRLEVVGLLAFVGLFWFAFGVSWQAVVASVVGFYFIATVSENN